MALFSSAVTARLTRAVFFTSALRGDMFEPFSFTVNTPIFGKPNLNGFAEVRKYSMRGVDKSLIASRLQEELRRWISAKAGRSAKALTDVADVTESQLSDLTRKGIVPRAPGIASLALAFGVSADYLLGLSSERTRVPEGEAERRLALIAKLASGEGLGLADVQRMIDDVDRGSDPPPPEEAKKRRRG